MAMSVLKLIRLLFKPVIRLDPKSDIVLVLFSQQEDINYDTY
ncbi:Uncharacterised protein [Sphingobacterium daejeonense]|nr:Uncharacterised protein [Sphingobacterium daejeonense]